MKDKNKVQYTRLLAARCTLPHGSTLLKSGHIRFITRCHIVINPLLETIYGWFWWQWKELNVNTLQENKMINDDIINRHCKC
jgi:hypothetical protein